MKIIKIFLINSFFTLLTACGANNLFEPTNTYSLPELNFPVHLRELVTLPINNTPIEQRSLAYCQHPVLTTLEEIHRNDLARWVIMYGIPMAKEVEQIIPTLAHLEKSDFGCISYPPYPTIFSLPGFEDEDVIGTIQVGLEWSPNGQYLLYNLERTRNYVAEFDAQGQLNSTNLLIDPPQYTFFERAQFPTWHPSGKEVAFVSTYMIEGNYLQDTDSIILIDFVKEFNKLNIRYFPETIQPLTYYNPISEQPVWSHDGSKLAYPLYSTSNGIGILDVTNKTIIRYDENHNKTIAKYTGDRQQRYILPNKRIAWLPGNKVILFTTHSKEKHQLILWAMELNTGEPFILYQGNIQQFALSPSGETVALLVQDNLNNTQSTLITLKLDNLVQEKTIITLDNWIEKNSSQLFMRDLNWSDDGRYLAFSARTTLDFDLFAWDVQTGAIMQLTDTPDFDEIAPHWRPTQN